MVKCLTLWYCEGAAIKGFPPWPSSEVENIWSEAGLCGVAVLGVIVIEKSLSDVG